MTGHSIEVRHRFRRPASATFGTWRLVPGPVGRTVYWCAILLSVISVVLSVTPSSEAAEQQRDGRPNVVLIMVDDLGKEWVSACGAESIETPHLDALAETGMLFRNFYVMPQCTPTRVTLLTGQYPFRHGWVNHWDVPRWGGGCSFDPELNPALPKLMQNAGYATAAAGKWQIDDFRQEPEAMSDAGFDQYLMWTGYEAGNLPSAKRYWDPYVYSSEGGRRLSGKFGPDVFTNFLIRFMREHHEQPMFVYYPMVLTHPPLVNTPDDVEAKEPLAKHRAMVRYADTLTGRIIETLDELGIRRNTLVLWTTDNGTSHGIVGRRHGRDVPGGKSLTLETGVCVPLIASWPGVVPAGRETDALADVTDLLPTLAALAGSPLPVGHVLDGHSILPVLRGQETSSSRRWILAMGGRNQARRSDRGVENRYWYRDRVLRNERFKLYVDSNRRVEKLIDLASDPLETTDVQADDDPVTRKALRELRAAADRLPNHDNDPKYRPLPDRPWYRKAKVRSQEWKTGYPGAKALAP